MKRTVRAMCLFGLGLVLLMVTAASAPAAEQFTINIMIAWTKNQPQPKFFLQDFIERIQKEADQKYPGELKLVYKGGPELVNTNEQITAVGKGMVDLIYSSESFYVSKMPELDILNLTPMKPWELKAVGLNDYLEKLHNEKTNTHYLVSNGTGGLSFQIGLTKPVKTLADFKGMNIRGNPTTVQAIKAVGANPVQMPLSDLYTAMERGMVQAYTIPAFGIRATGTDKVTKYLLFPGFYDVDNCLLFNLDKWKKMPKYLQDFLTEQADIHSRNMVQFNHDLEKTELEALKAGGIEFINLPKEDAEKFKKLTDDALINVCMEKAPVETKKIMEYFAKKP